MSKAKVKKAVVKKSPAKKASLSSGSGKAIRKPVDGLKNAQGLAPKLTKAEAIESKVEELKAAQRLNRFMEDIDPDQESGILKMDGYDDCVVGIVTRYGIDGILCYDVDKVIAKLMKQGMSYEEAQEWFEYNQIGAWVGEKTPCFVKMMPK